MQGEGTRPPARPHEADEIGAVRSTPTVALGGCLHESALFATSAPKAVFTGCLPPWSDGPRKPQRHEHQQSLDSLNTS